VAMMRSGRARRAALFAMISFFVLVSALAASALPASAQTATPTQGAPASTAAGQTPVIATAELQLWPEYDDPGVLVILSGQFAEGTTFPLQATFPVPPGARNIQATYQDASESLINRPFDVKDGKLTYEVPSRAFHIEYYVDRAPSGEQRDIAYDFVAPYATDALRVTVQQPARASGFTLSPASESSETRADGLTYYLFNRRNLAAREKLPIDIKYTKADSGLSAPQLAVAATSGASQPAAAAAPAAAAGATSSSSLLPYLLIGLGLVLLVGVAAYYLLSRRSAAAASVPAGAAARGGTSPAATGKTRPATARSVPPPARAAPESEPAADAVSFCTNCGHPLKPEDRFCSQCGAPRRS
jgi:hypothetical protein